MDRIQGIDRVVEEPKAGNSSSLVIPLRSGKTVSPVSAKTVKKGLLDRIYGLFKYTTTAKNVSQSREEARRNIPTIFFPLANLLLMSLVG